MRTETLQLEHTETLLDVVFGVVIAVALADLPGLVSDALEKWGRSGLVDVLLLTASLIFATFYWLEVRHFIAEQHRFNLAVGNASESEEDSGVPVELAKMLLGTLLMMTVASGVLTFARDATFGRYLVASSLFWVVDFLGSIVLRTSYRRFREIIRAKEESFRQEHAWYLGHMDSKFFMFYGALNAAFFALIFAADYRLSQQVWHVWWATGILALTVFRHGFWRSRIYVWARRRAAGSAA